MEILNIREILMLATVVYFSKCDGRTMTVNMRGAGASFPSKVYTAWTSAFRSQRSEFVNINATYETIGSGGGKSRIKEGKNLEYAGTDSLLNEEDYQDHPDLQMLPTMAGAVVMAYNLPGVKNLILSLQVVVGIYNGTYRKWDDPAIQVLNTNYTLPSEDITVVARADKSGTTEIFTKALSSFDARWKARYGYFSEGIDEDREPIHWQKWVVSIYGKTTSGMSGLILSLPYSIGYLSVTDAKELQIPYAYLMNRAGKVVAPNALNVQKAMDAKVGEFSERFTVDLENAADSLAYPMSGYTYLIIYMTTMADCQSAIELYRYIEWFIQDSYAQSECTYNNMVPLSRNVALRIETEILKHMKCHGLSVQEDVLKQKRKEKEQSETWRLPVFIVAPILTFCIFILVGVVIWSHIKVNKAMWRKEYLLKDSELSILPSKEAMKSKLSLFSSSLQMDKLGTSQKSLVPESLRNGFKMASTVVAKFKDKYTVLLETELKSHQTLSTKTKRNMLWMQQRIHHANVLDFFGVSEYNSRLCLVYQYCDKGKLRDILQNDRFSLNENFKFSMTNDLASGMVYLHQEGIVHGQLRSDVCFIDSRWTVKVGSWEQELIQQVKKEKRFKVRPLEDRQMEEQIDEKVAARAMFWEPPEYLETETRVRTKEGDMYSFAIILIEIFTRADPYAEIAGNTSPQTVLKQVKSKGLRPDIPNNLHVGMQQFLTEAWHRDPKRRPTFRRSLKILSSHRPSSQSVMDCMMAAVENYATQLEVKVQHRTEKLNEALLKVENLLHQMLPKSVAIKLAAGESISPESYSNVTIYFSDIVGFTTLSAMSTPMEIVAMLNDLYTCFDAIIDKHEVYKVETIGDAYMVISGCPILNGTMHASHIASMALDLACASSSFVIRHRPDIKLQMRIGIHSGAVVAGVVGTKMPRYCLFGDTVNTASRMESTCITMKIQISETTHALLCDIGGFHIEQRGTVQVKGKGSMKTYWLHGKDGHPLLPIDFLRAEDVTINI